MASSSSSNNNSAVMINNNSLQSFPSSTHLITLDRVKVALQRNNNQLQQTSALQEANWRQSYHNRMLLAARETLARSLKEKDEKINRTLRRVTLLQNRLNTEKMEATVWREVSKDQRATISSLRDQLQQALRDQLQQQQKTKEDETESKDDGEAESVGENLGNDDAGSIFQAPVRTRERDQRGLKGVCRECEDRMATVVLLPCRHLCLCAQCNEEVAPVPCHICRCFRTGFFDVYLT